MKKLIVCLAVSALLATPALFAGGEACSKAQAEGCPIAKTEACPQAKASCPAQQQVKACCPMQGKSDQTAKAESTKAKTKATTQTVASRK
jgi:hypothetical protein